MAPARRIDPRPRQEATCGICSDLTSDGTGAGTLKATRYFESDLCSDLTSDGTGAGTLKATFQAFLITRAYTRARARIKFQNGPVRAPAGGWPFRCFLSSWFLHFAGLYIHFSMFYLSDSYISNPIYID